MKIILATHNRGKIREFERLFTPLGWTIVPQGELHIGEAPEPYFTFIENALNKARSASRASGLPALADDSGIIASALHQQPGIFSARFAGEPANDNKNNAKLSELLRDQPDKTVFYYCALVFIRSEKDPTPIIAEGKWVGRWVTEPRGDRGFGYDPHFYLPELKKTAGELTPAVKNRLSHRGRATRALMRQLQRVP